MPAPARFRPTPLALLVAGAFFMEFLDGSIIATALPRMAPALHSTAVRLNIGISAYLMTVAVFILPSGWLAGRFGTRRIFASAVAIFTLGSILCGASPTEATFIASRVLQGIGGAMMVPVGRLAVLRTTAKQDLMGAIAVLTWPGLAAPVIAPPIGGFLADYASWRWIFFINVPLGVAGFLLALRLVPAASAEVARRRFDSLGFVLGALTALAATATLDTLGNFAAPPWRAAFLAGAFALGLWLLLRHLHRAPHPLIRLTPIGIPTFRATLYGGTAMRTLISSMPFVLPLYFQLGFGMDATSAGLLVLGLFAGNIGIKPFTTPLLRRFGFRRVLLGNGLLQAATMLGAAALSPDTPVPVVFALLVVSGASRSTQFTAINTLAYADVPQRLMNSANTLFSVAFQLANGFGVSLGAIALRTARASFGSPAQTTYLAQDFRFALIGLAILMTAISLDALRLAPTAGAVVTRGRSA